MKIAVITLHRVYNYGSVLQAYATQVVLERAGHEVVIIDYLTPRLTLKRRLLDRGTTKRVGLKRAVYLTGRAGSIFLKEKTFGAFVKRRLHLTRRYVTPEELQQDPPQADVYVTGSDQTWNSDYNEGIDRGFFLDFIPAGKRRVAFVASFGKERLDDGEVAQTRSYIDRYQALSVREDAAVNILHTLGRGDAVQLIDPTLQLTRQEWLRVASGRLVKAPYLLLMLLYNEDNHATEYARKLADERGLRLVKLCWNLRRPPEVDVLMTHRTPADFLSLFYHADFIITNSFHGTAFAINFGKSFSVVPRNEYNSRIESLLRLCDLQQRQVSSYDDVLRCSQTPIDYERVERILDRERERASEFVAQAITGE